MKRIELEPLAIEDVGDDVIRRCHIRRIDGEQEISKVELWFQFDKSIPALEYDDCDSYLLAVLMDAMTEGRDIVVKGSVSRTLLSNLCEFQGAWHKWLPEVYSIVDITVDSLRDHNLVVSGAVCAFSGGVDATFSVWRHSQKKYSFRSQDIKLCSMVHGLDIPIGDDAAFNNACKRAKETLIDIDINLIPLRTNYREVATANWEHAHACALVGCLTHFKLVAGTCIVGSSEAYDALVIPWGSSPITDHLLSSDDFIVIHDGATHDRTEKVSEIAEWTVGTENLRVCWEGDLKDRNCGHCEKCLRTQFNFLVSGQQIQKCFPEGRLNVNKVFFRNEIVRGEWLQIYEYAKKNCENAKWMPQLTWMVKRELLIYSLFPRGSSQRKIVASIRNILRR